MDGEESGGERGREWRWKERRGEMEGEERGDGW